MKKFLRVSIITFSGLTLLAFLAIAGLGLFFAPSKVEVATVISPDKNLVASVTEINGGATTSFRYVVKVKSKNQISSFSKDIANLIDATRSNCAYGVDLEWRPEDVLLIKYFESQNTELLSNIIKVGDKTVTVKLVSGIINNSAPCGGMEYNLKQ